MCCKTRENHYFLIMDRSRPGQDWSISHSHLFISVYLKKKKMSPPTFYYTSQVSTHTPSPKQLLATVPMIFMLLSLMDISQSSFYLSHQQHLIQLLTPSSSSSKCFLDLAVLPMTYDCPSYLNGHPCPASFAHFSSPWPHVGAPGAESSDFSSVYSPLIIL